MANENVKSIEEQLRELLLNDTVLPDIEIKEKIVHQSQLENSFAEIVEFYKEHSRLPEERGGGVNERRLRISFNGIQSDPEKKQQLRDIDIHGILDISTEDDLVSSKYTPMRKRNSPDNIAEYKRCADFEQFIEGFKRINIALSNGELKRVRYVHRYKLEVGDYIYHRSRIGYIASEGEHFNNASGINDYRCRVIYDDGTEINILHTSLVGTVFRDKDSCKIIRPEDEFVLNGYIYVLATLSDDPVLAPYKKNLYKIGMTTGSIEKRIANAHKSTTYLEAPVELIVHSECRGSYSARAMEKALHRLLASRSFNVTITDKEGNDYKPKEWFHVPLETINDLIYSIDNGTIDKYYVSPATGKLIKR